VSSARASSSRQTCSKGQAEMRFGESVRVVWKRKNLDQQELANAAGLSLGLVTKSENRRLNFGEYTF
jgi:hypothetical protein